MLTKPPTFPISALGQSGYAHYGYANQWWTLGGEHRAFTGLGVHGQYLFVDPVAGPDRLGRVDPAYRCLLL